MQITVEILFALLRAAVNGVNSIPAFSAKTVDWEAAYRLAARQEVQAVAFDGLQKLLEAGKIPAEEQPLRTTKIAWSYSVSQIEERYRRQRQVIGKLALFYAEHGMRMMILKGYGLSLLYSVPEHRPCSDVDIWLYGRQKEADVLLTREKKIQIHTGEHHHTVFTLDGILIENHYDFLNIHAHVSSRAIEQRLQAFVKEPDEAVLVGETQLFLPAANFNALFLLRHTASHFAASGIVLRQVLDWALFIDHYRGQIDFEALELIAREYNMQRFLHCLYALSADCLGISLEGIPPFERDAALERRVLNDILSPEFADKQPGKNLLQVLYFKYRRWWANRWKHRLVYNENLAATFFVQIWSHLLKPKSFKN